MLSQYNKIKNNFINYHQIIINKNDINFNNNSNFQKEDITSKLKYYQNFVGELQIYNHTHIYSNNIYWCWLQGIDNAPDLYKANYNNKDKNSLKN